MNQSGVGVVLHDLLDVVSQERNVVQVLLHEGGKESGLCRDVDG